MGADKRRARRDRSEPSHEARAAARSGEHRPFDPYAPMQVRETAVVPYGIRIDEARYPEVVERMLGHVRGVMRSLEEQQVDILLLRDGTRAALARLKAA